jgi:hypothetical protein
MNRRDANLLELKDILEHLTACRQQLAWTENSEAIRLITESMLRDLDDCRRLCERLNPRFGLQTAI